MVLMKVVDLFSGCGGMSLGFQNAGFNIVAAYENWKPALDTYKTNFSHPAYELDLASEEAKEIIKSHEPDLIIGGPPCQDFSIAGKRDETQGRADLTISFAKIIEHASPTYFVMENVGRIQKSRVFKNAESIFKAAGYGLTKMVLDASLCDVPQQRKRFFLIGSKNDQDGFLESSLKLGLSDKPKTMHDYFGDSLGVEYYFRIPTSYSRRAVFSIYEPSKTIRCVDRPIPKTYKKHPGDLVEIGDKVRALTIKERSMSLVLAFECV
jgi:DNA (cytosine-5)-methyltransferase 1